MKFFLIVTFLGLVLTACSKDTLEKLEETGKKTGDLIEETADDAQRSAKKTVRDIKDKTCELIDGKLECAVEALKHDIENAVDDSKDFSE